MKLLDGHDQRAPPSLEGPACQVHHQVRPACPFLRL